MPRCIIIKLMKTNDHTASLENSTAVSFTIKPNMLSTTISYGFWPKWIENSSLPKTWTQLLRATLLSLHEWMMTKLSHIYRAQRYSTPKTRGSEGMGKGALSESVGCEGTDLSWPKLKSRSRCHTLWRQEDLSWLSEPRLKSKYEDLSSSLRTQIKEQGTVPHTVQTWRPELTQIKGQGTVPHTVRHKDLSWSSEPRLKGRAWCHTLVCPALDRQRGADS